MGVFDPNVTCRGGPRADGTRFSGRSHQQNPIRPGVLPVLLHRPAPRHLAIAAALAEPWRTGVGVGHDDAQATLAGVGGQPVRHSEKRGAAALAAVLWYAASTFTYQVAGARFSSALCCPRCSLSSDWRPAKSWARFGSHTTC